MSNSPLAGRRASDGFVHIPTSSSIFQHHPAAAVAAAGFVPLASRAGGHFDLHDVTEEHVVQLQQVYSLTICLPLFVDKTRKKVFKSYCLPMLSLLCDLFLFPRRAAKWLKEAGAPVLTCQLPPLRAEGSKNIKNF